MIFGRHKLHTTASDVMPIFILMKTNVLEGATSIITYDTESRVVLQSPENTIQQK